MSEAQRRFAAQLVQNPSLSHSSILDEFSLPQANATAMQATVQHFSRKLGRIRDLLHELDTLAFDFPNLSNVGFLKSAVLRLSFLDLDSETKFTVFLRGGGLEKSFSSPLLHLCPSAFADLVIHSI